MRILFFSTQPYDRKSFDLANRRYGYECRYLEYPLNEDNVALVKGEEAVCVFVNDRVNAAVLEQLHEKGVKMVALRCAGFNNVDLEAAVRLGVRVARVPAYSPHAVAEHAVALLLALNRKICKAYNRIREHNFTLSGLEGFDLYGKTIGVVGTGNIGAVFCRIMQGFGCRVLAYDIKQDPALLQAGVTYTALEQLFALSDIVSLHCPLNEHTRHLINAAAINSMKPGVMIINTSRGALIDTPAVVNALKTGHIGALAIDVYEQEEQLFFHDLSGSIIQDDVIARLMTFPNVLITSHQGFFTTEALTQIADTTLQNIAEFRHGPF